MIFVMLVEVQVLNNVIGIQKLILAKIGRIAVNKNKLLIVNIVGHVFGIQDHVINYNANISMKTHALTI